MTAVTFRTRRAAFKWARAFSLRLVNPADLSYPIFGVTRVLDCTLFGRRRTAFSLHIPEQYEADAKAFFPREVINQ